MNQTTELQNHNLIHQTSDEYESEGYEVTIAPTKEQLPRFLHPFDIDMIATSETENIVVELRTKSTLTDLPRLEKLAAAVENQNGWRVDLVVNQEKTTYQRGMSLDIEDIKYRLQEAHELSQKEHGEAALLLTWSTLEALLRRDAQVEEVPLEHDDNPIYLIKSLFSYGLLDREQYQLLKSGVQVRDTIVHGYKKPQSFIEILNELLSLADNLVEGPLPA